MGKRKTAKTGDKALYKSRDKHQDGEVKNKKFIDDDDMYNEVDRYNNAKNELEDDMLRFGHDDDSEEDAEEGVQNDVEGVFDLGLDYSEDESDVDGSEGDESSTEERKSNQKALDDSGHDDDDDDDDDDSLNEIDQSEPDLFNWGKRKTAYYHGDTADLEIMDEKDAIEDAELEEEGAKAVLKARMQNMTEEDFMLEEEEDESDKEGKETLKYNQIEPDEIQSTKRRKLSHLSKKEKIKFLSKNHPELVPLVSHFRDEAIRPCHEKTLLVVNALMDNEENSEAVGATSSGLQYILTKAMIQASTALNVCQYLLIKADHASSAINDEEDNILNVQEEEKIKSHPVIQRLNQLNQLAEKLETKVESKVQGLGEQLESLVKATKLMRELSNDDDHDDMEQDGDEVEETLSGDDSEKSANQLESQLTSKHEGSELIATSESEDDSTSSSLQNEDEDEAVLQKRLMNEARFAFRRQDEEHDSSRGSNNRHERRAVPSDYDFGDEDDANENDIAAAGRTLASTINRISQRSKPNKKSTFAPEESDMMGDEERLRKGMEMMEAELGDLEDDELSDNDDAELDADSLNDDEDDFYAQIKKKSKAKKEFKKNLYAVAPKYPVFDEQIEGERAIGSKILKNRGLVAHKSKLNRNPRVKKREQYRKALIKRKGAVREVRTDEGHKYGGETTGIKAGVSRSRKLGAK